VMVSRHIIGMVVVSRFTEEKDKTPSFLWGE
jgi:hypothetical protein